MPVRYQSAAQTTNHEARYVRGALENRYLRFRACGREYGPIRSCRNSAAVACTALSH